MPTLITKPMKHANFQCTSCSGFSTCASFPQLTLASVTHSDCSQCLQLEGLRSERLQHGAGAAPWSHAAAIARPAPLQDSAHSDKGDVPGRSHSASPGDTSESPLPRDAGSDASVSHSLIRLLHSLAATGDPSTTTPPPASDSDLSSLLDWASAVSQQPPSPTDTPPYVAPSLDAAATLALVTELDTAVLHIAAACTHADGVLCVHRPIIERLRTALLTPSPVAPASAVEGTAFVSASALRRTLSCAGMARRLAGNSALPTPPPFVGGVEAWTPRGSRCWTRKRPSPPPNSSAGIAAPQAHCVGGVGRSRRLALRVRQGKSPARDGAARWQGLPASAMDGALLCGGLPPPAGESPCEGSLTSLPLEPPVARYQTRARSTPPGATDKRSASPACLLPPPPSLLRQMMIEAPSVPLFVVPPVDTIASSPDATPSLYPRPDSTASTELFSSPENTCSASPTRSPATSFVTEGLQHGVLDSMVLESRQCKRGKASRDADKRGPRRKSEADGVMRQRLAAALHQVIIIGEQVPSPLRKMCAVSFIILQA
jgi:hypothetical protein